MHRRDRCADLAFERSGSRSAGPRAASVAAAQDVAEALEFTIGGYATRGNDILGKAVANDLRGEPEQQHALDALGLPYTVVGYMNGPGYSGANTQQPEGPKRLTPITSGFQGIAQGRPDLSAVDTADPDYLQEATVPMHRETHSAEDVPVYAGGPGAQRFHGVQEQSYLYHAMVEALGWHRESAPDR